MSTAFLDLTTRGQVPDQHTSPVDDLQRRPYGPLPTSRQGPVAQTAISTSWEIIHAPTRRRNGRESKGSTTQRIPAFANPVPFVN